jgi:hypothetical protein
MARRGARRRGRWRRDARPVSSVEPTSAITTRITIMNRSPTVFALLAAATLAACTVRPPPASYSTQTATVAPPPPRVEVVPPPPAPIELVVWVPGHWSWDGRAYVWESGHYIERPGARAEYEPGHWVQTAAGWSWVPGHWR